MRLAYFSPLGPQHSGISDYSEELLPHLASTADITLYVDGFHPHNAQLNSRFEIRDYRRQRSLLKDLNQFDAVIYHMGNDHRYHAHIFETLLAYKGIVVLHDFALQDFFLGLSRDRNQPNLYLDEVEYCHGKKVRDVAATEINRGATPSIAAQPLKFPLNKRVVSSAEGVIVHSEWARQRLMTIAPGVPVVHIPMPIKFDAANGNGKRTTGEVHLASFGLITPGKGIELSLKSLAKLRKTHSFRYTLVGETNAYYDVQQLIHQAGMTDLVDITGHVSLDEFKQRMQETDIALNIRERTVGETSASLCRLMASGVCSVVADVGWYQELPNDCVVKVPLDSDADRVLTAYLERLIEDAELRKRIADNARGYAHSRHAAEVGAAAYMTFVQEVVDGRTQRDFVASVTNELVQLGTTDRDEAFLNSVAQELSILKPTIESQPLTPKVSQSFIPQNGRTPKVEGIDYKQAAREYLGRLSAERFHHLRTKPFYNLANKPAKYRNEGMDEDSHRHFCDFANMAVTLALPAGSRVLEVGCGSGWLCEYFARLGYDVKGIDISPDLIQMSRERVEGVPYGVDHETPLQCAFEVHDIEASALNEKFDAIICYDSLHHFEDEHAVMRHLAQMLDVGGVLFILEGERPPSGSESETELVDVMKEFGTLESPFNYSHLRRLLDENGFAVIGDYASINGLFDRTSIVNDQLPLTDVALNYHYLSCKKVAEAKSASTVPDSVTPGLLRAKFVADSVGPIRLLPGENFELKVVITNEGDTLWIAGRQSRMGVVMPAVKVIDDQGSIVSEVHGQPPLPRPVAPGETIKLTIEHAAPILEGKYQLKIDLVDQHICWFETVGSSPLIVELEVM